MEKINKFIKNNLLGLLIAVFLIGILSLVLLIVTSNKYEDEISRLKIENKKLTHQKKLDNNTIEQLQKKEQEKCNCGWYEDFYYDNAEGCGAYE